MDQSRLWEEGSIAFMLNDKVFPEFLGGLLHHFQVHSKARKSKVQNPQKN